MGTKGAKYKGHLQCCMLGKYFYNFSCSDTVILVYYSYEVDKHSKNQSTTYVRTSRINQATSRVDNHPTNQSTQVILINSEPISQHIRLINTQIVNLELRLINI